MGEIKVNIREIKHNKKIIPLLIIICTLLFSQPALADPHPGQSVNVAFVGSPSASSGGTLPALPGFNFVNLAPAAVNPGSLANVDTVVLNVASSEMACTTNTLSLIAKADLNNFVANGGKLIIYDSECQVVDYTWLTYSFLTSNPGPIGFTGGTLTIVEENILSSTPIDPLHVIDTNAITVGTDAVTDTNVVDLVTVDPNWCLDLTGTNYYGDSGAVHMYAKSGTGLYIYNGLDIDYIINSVDATGGGQLAKIWLQELEAEPSLLPCGIPVVGITLEPEEAENEVGQNHTITATLTDLLGNPQPNSDVAFDVILGPNFGEGGTDTTDANGQASFTYTGDGGVGVDEIVACFINEDGGEICSKVVTKEWIDTIPPKVECIETVNPHGKNVPPAGSTTLPGPKGGQNEDGFYMLRAIDNSGLAPMIWLNDTEGSFTFGPYPIGTKIKYTEANGATPSEKKIGSDKGQAGAVDYHIKGQGDLMVSAVDASGNVETAICYVAPLPK